MTKVIRPSLLLVLTAAAITMALLLAGVLGGQPAPVGAATKRPHARTHQARVHQARHARRSQATGGKETAGEGESAGESDADGPGGHQDPPGENIDHQCPPDCAPGEQP
jgi:hypothetical protein